MKNVEKLVEKQRIFCHFGKCRDIEFRKRVLQRLKKLIIENEGRILEALREDLNKSPMEGYMTEVGLVLSELDYVLKHLDQWAAKKRIPTPLAQFHSQSFTVSEPYGSVLIMAAWNYPLLLTMQPFIGAIAAGNCCVIKPSAYAPHMSALLAELISSVFPPYFAAVIEGGREENVRLLDCRFDYIFFTGSPSVGKTVMKKAAENLTPVTLELGGKSPCIVDKTADLKLAARRIVFGKFLNAGQTCVAPDYLLVDASVKKELTRYLCYWIHKMLGENPLENRDYPKIINEKHYNRLLNLLTDGHLVIGGQADRDKLKIEPAVMDFVDINAAIMREEIFGPILPVLTYTDIDQVIRYLSRKEKPLALYLFTQSRTVEDQVLSRISFGGGCINDTVIHLATSRMGFGGVGGSGMGSYHGKRSFETFSHEKSIVKKSNWIDLPFRYQPYSERKEKLMRRFL